MSFLSLIRKLAGGVALAIPVVAFGQAGFAPLGGEYAIVGALPGDQVMPSVSVSSSGGYIVWQDNATDGDGWGISGRVLDGSLSGVGTPFRINSTSKADQENAQVALLKNGGAVFVWQGGRQGFQHIYARFLSVSNTWLALDQMVNASAKIYQANPAVAVLNNGNVVIVYAGFNASTMQDVYGQIFSPTGQKVGSEFQINQQTAFNQRSPSLAALPAGGFVVTWISEQQQRATVDVSSQNHSAAALYSSQPSVDVYARLFDQSGNGLIQEFPVNAGVYTCANPVVAGAADGSMIFAWSGKDQNVLNNGWDVYARAFTFSGGVPQGPVEQRINTQLYGDQFAPRISSLGNSYLVAWTSMGQDGSASGIYGQFLNADASANGVEVRINSNVLGAQQEPVLAADGTGRFLAAWTSPSFGASRNDLFAQIYSNGNSVSPSATNVYTSPIFVGDAPAKTDSASSRFLPGPYVEPPTLSYPGAIAADSTQSPPTNAFILAAGNYSGLFYESAGVSPGSAGYVALKIGNNGSYSGKFLMGGKSYSLGAGKLDSSGVMPTKTISRQGLSPLVVNLKLDLIGGQQISGTIAAGTQWVSAFVADRQAQNAAAYAGAYTIIIPPASSGPGGDGYGTIKLTAAGTVNFTGKLGDGTSISAGATLSHGGIWPLYFGTSGQLVMSWIQFNVAPPANDSGGDLVWIQQSQKSAKAYAGGFTNQVAAVAALNLPPVQGAYQLQLNGAALPGASDYAIQVGLKNKVSNLSANKLSLTINASGTFTGSANVTGVSKPISFSGALLKGGGGAGYFINGGQSGEVKLSQP